MPKNTSSQPPRPLLPTPAQRGWAAGLWLTTLITPLALIVGLVTFIRTRTRNPFLARHAARAAGWQLLFNAVLVPLVLLYARQAQIPEGIISSVIGAQLPLVFTAPARLLELWPGLAPQAQQFLGVVLGVLGVNVLAALTGGTVALCGERPQPAATPCACGHHEAHTAG